MWDGLVSPLTPPSLRTQLLERHRGHSSILAQCLIVSLTLVKATRWRLMRCVTGVPLPSREGRHLTMQSFQVLRLRTMPTTLQRATTAGDNFKQFLAGINFKGDSPSALLERSLTSAMQ